jgi:hypothetical protein
MFRLIVGAYVALPLLAAFGAASATDLKTGVTDTIGTCCSSCEVGCECCLDSQCVCESCCAADAESCCASGESCELTSSTVSADALCECGVCDDGCGCCDDDQCSCEGCECPACAT